MVAYWLLLRKVKNDQVDNSTPPNISKYNNTDKLGKFIMIEDLLEYLKKNKSALVKEWVSKLRDTNPTYQKIRIEESLEISSVVFDAFCSIVENNHFEPMRLLIEKMTRERRFPGISFSESQEAFSNVRYILFPILIERYQGEDLLNILNRINHVIDMIIFCFSHYFKESNEKKLKNYATNLEDEVQKRTHELEESRKNYQILLEEISDGCYVNQGGKVVFANKAFCEMHGYGIEEIIGKECRILIAEDSRERVTERFRSHLKREIPFQTYICCRQTKKGQLFPTENRVKQIRYNDKPAFLGLCTDITERLEMEEKINQKDRLALIGRLTTSIAHEVRNPLSAIKVNLQLLLNKLQLDGNNLRRLQIAGEQVIQLENIISQMMDFAKPIKLNYKMASISAIIDHAMELLEDKTKMHNVSLIIEAVQGLPNIMIDKEKMLEAIVNVFANALEAFDGSSKKKKIEFMAKIRLLNDRKHIDLSIKDNGLGIVPEDLKNIFEPFFTKGKKDGVGLGLPIVKKIVEAHNGIIQVQSEKMKGTSFHLIIPVDITQ